MCHSSILISDGKREMFGSSKAVSVTALILYSVVFSEGFLRLFSPQPLIPRYVTGGTDGIRANMRNVSFRQVTPEVDVNIVYNSAGMRDDRPPPPLRRGVGECRIALIGDSYFVGFESDFASSFGARLEADMARRGRPCRVLNFAVSGFGTAEMLVALKNRVIPYDPNVVIMSWHSSDPADNIRSGLYGLDGNGKLIQVSKTFLPGVHISDILMTSLAYRWLIENSQLYSAVRESLGMFFKDKLAEFNGARLSFSKFKGRPTFSVPTSVSHQQVVDALDSALVSAVDEVTRTSGAHLLIFDIPSPISRNKFRSNLYLLQPTIVSRISTADPIDAFTRASRDGRAIYLERGERHWTRLGNAVTAEVAATAIADNGWAR